MLKLRESPTLAKPRRTAQFVIAGDLAGMRQHRTGKLVEHLQHQLVPGAGSESRPARRPSCGVACGLARYLGQIQPHVDQGMVPPRDVAQINACTWQFSTLPSRTAPLLAARQRDSVPCLGNADGSKTSSASPSGSPNALATCSSPTHRAEAGDPIPTGPMNFCKPCRSRSCRYAIDSTSLLCRSDISPET